MHCGQQLGKRWERGDEWIRASLVLCCVVAVMLLSSDEFNSHFVVYTECHHLQEKNLRSPQYFV